MLSALESAMLNKPRVEPSDVLPSVIPLPIAFPVARDNCYCPKCHVWYNCASDAHAGH